MTGKNPECKHLSTKNIVNCFKSFCFTTNVQTMLGRGSKTFTIAASPGANLCIKIWDIYSSDILTTMTDRMLDDM